MITNQWIEEVERLRKENKKLKEVVKKLGIIAFVFIGFTVYMIAAWVILESIQ